MTISPTQESQPTRVVCPPRCKAAEEMSQHEVEVGAAGQVEVNHEVDFGKYAFGNVIQRLDGSPVEAYVTICGDEFTDPTRDPAALRRIAADLMNAADWLESLR
jgi:hypothetical protein